MNKTDHIHDQDDPIAERYDALQGLEHLRKAWKARAVPEASQASTVKAVMQAAQIALFNMQDLLERATRDLEKNDIAAAATKREWEARFSRILNDLSRIPERIAGTAKAHDSVSIITTPAFDGYFSALRAFDKASGQLPLDEVIGSGSMSDPAYRLVQHTRLSAYDSLPWERNLRHVNTGIKISPEDEVGFLGSHHLQQAVHALAANTPSLKDGTFFNQFRGLHQIPEILVHEQNSHLERAIADIRSGKLRAALEHLDVAEALFEPIVGCVRLMAETLTTDDYHRFRKHLGLTSGSHSEEIRHRLFIKNYRELWEGVAAVINPSDKTTLPDTIREIDAHRFDNEDSHLKHQLLNACQRFRASVLRWKDSHLHLAKINLGGGGTKSLIGSPDAVKAVTHMLETAHGEYDPMRPLLQVRGVDVLPKTHAYGPLEKHMADPDAFVAHIEQTTGDITRARFPDVQYRTGRYERKPDTQERQ